MSGTCYPQSGEGDGDFCSWKSASTVMLGQFSYMLFASLKYVKSCHSCEVDSIGIVLNNTSISNYSGNGFF